MQENTVISDNHLRIGHGWSWGGLIGILIFFFLGSNIPLALIGLCTGLGYETLDDNSTMRRNRWRENKRVNVTVS